MKVDLRELKEIIQSSNINILIGAGASRPYLPALGDIETSINEAQAAGDSEVVIEQLKLYFTTVMLPSRAIIDIGVGLSEVKPTPDELSPRETFNQTYLSYKHFFESINTILLNRKSTLLNKQVNLFTTNIDLFIEMALEDTNLEYNDGFSGNIIPEFHTSNFSKSIHKTSAHFNNISEIPTFNVFKLHGSLTWRLDEHSKEIIYSKLDMLDTIEAQLESNDEFRVEYDKLQIINPTKDKFRETVMGVTHYDMLRIYSSELEKENSVLFVIGFSMADDHIREITKRVADSNPTLKIYLFCHDLGETFDNYTEWFRDMRYQNIQIVTPDEGTRYDLKTIDEMFFQSILNVSAEKILEEQEELNESEIAVSDTQVLPINEIIHENRDTSPKEGVINNGND